MNYSPSDQKSPASDWRWALSAYLAIVGLYLWGSAPLRSLWLFYDELGYWGLARSIAHAGVMPNLSLPDGNNYFPGYPLLIAPAFGWGSMAFTYRLVLGLNAAMMGALFWPLFYYLRRLRGVALPAAIAMAAVLCAYPACALHTQTVMAENAFVPLCAVAFVLVHETFRKRAPGLLAATALLVGFTYAIHPRGLVLCGATAAVFAAGAVAGTLPRRAVALALLLMASAVVATQGMNACVLALGYSGVKGPSSSIRLIVDRLLVQGDGTSPLLLLLGQALYLGVASCGLAYLGAWEAAATVARGCRRGSGAWAAPAVAASLWLLLSLGGSFFLTALSVAPMLRAEWLLYGRYNEAILPVLMALGLVVGAAANRGTGAAARLRPWVVVLVLALVAFAMARPTQAAFARLPFNLHGIPAMGVYAGLLETSERVGLALGLGVVAAAAVVFALRRSLALALMALAALFAASQIQTRARLVLPIQRQMTYAYRLHEIVRKLPGATALAYDMAAWNPHSCCIAQFHLPDVRFRQFDSRTDGPPPEDLVITSPATARTLPGYRILGSDPDGQHALCGREGATTGPSPYLTQAVTRRVLRPEDVVASLGFFPDNNWTCGDALLGGLRWAVDPAARELVLTLKALPPHGATVVELGLAVGVNRLPLAALGQEGLCFRFALPPGVTEISEVTIRSRTFTPRALGWANDTRELGVAVDTLALE